MKFKIMIMALLLVSAVGIGSAVNYLPASTMAGDLDFGLEHYITSLANESKLVWTVGFTPDCDVVLEDSPTVCHAGAINAILNAASAKNKASDVPSVVMLKNGRYNVINESIVVRHFTTLMGMNRPGGGAWLPSPYTTPDIKYRYTVINVTYEGDSAIRMNGASTLSNLAIVYPNQKGYNASWDWIQYPAAIYLIPHTADGGIDSDGNNEGVKVSNIFMPNPWIGLDLTDKHTFAIFEDIYMAPFFKGVYIGSSGIGSTEPTIYRNIRVHSLLYGYDTLDYAKTNLWKFVRGNLTAFDINRDDGARFSDCYVYWANQGFIFRNTMGVRLINCGTDNMGLYGLRLNGVKRATVTGGLWHGNVRGITIDGTSSGNIITGLNILSGGRGIYIESSGLDTTFYEPAWGNIVSGCNIRFNTNNAGYTYGIEVAAGKQTSITGNVINGLNKSMSGGIAVVGSATDTMISGNIITGCPNYGVTTSGTNGVYSGNLFTSSGPVDYTGAGTWGGSGNVSV